MKTKSKFLIFPLLVAGLVYLILLASRFNIAQEGVGLVIPVADFIVYLAMLLVYSIFMLLFCIKLFKKNSHKTLVPIILFCCILFSVLWFVIPIRENINAVQNCKDILANPITNSQSPSFNTNIELFQNALKFERIELSMHIILMLGCVLTFGSLMVHEIILLVRSKRKNLT